MKFLIFTATFLTLLVAFDSGNKFEIGDCIHKNGTQYKVLDIIEDVYIVGDYATVTREKKSIIETQFIKGSCK